MASPLLDSQASINTLRGELLRGYQIRLERMYARKIYPVSSAKKISSQLSFYPFVARLRRTSKTAPCGRKRTRRTARTCTPEKCKSKSAPAIRHTFFDRATLTHREYTNVLSTPHLYRQRSSRRKFRSKRIPSVCYKRRINQLAQPTALRVFCTLKEHVRHIPADIRLRLRNLLRNVIHYKKTLTDASYHFKCIDAKERRGKFKKIKEGKEDRGRWFIDQIDATAEVIIKFFSTKKDTPVMNYKRRLIFESLVDRIIVMLKNGDLGKKCNCDIVIDDQFVLILHHVVAWITKAMNMADVQTAMDLGLFDKKPSKAGVPEEELEGGEGEGEEWGGEVGAMSSLERLIWILAQASSDYLGDKVDDLENVTRNELLNKIKALNKDYAGADTPAEILRRIIFEWAMHTHPSQIDVLMIKKIEMVAQLLAAMLAAEDLYGMMNLAEIGTLGTVSFRAGEGGEEGPLPGTVTEVEGPDGAVQMGVVDDLGGITPVQLTPSGNLIPTVYDRNGKVVKELYDPDGNLLETTFNKYGVPEPDTYNGELFDDVKYAHELIYNSKGRIIPLCYDKDGNPIGADYDADGNPIWYGPDGSIISVPPGGFLKLVNGKLVLFDGSGEMIGEVKGAGETDLESMMMDQAEESELSMEEEGEEESEESSTVEEEEESSEIEEVTEEEKSSIASGDSMIKLIKGHAPKKVYEHSASIACCLSVKIWAVWLIDVSHNAISWSKWISNIVGKVREYAGILRGDVLLPNGQKKVLFANDWKEFLEGMNDDIVAWRQYDRHVKDLSSDIIKKFDGKQVRCCAQCRDDILVKDVVSVHETIRALTEALNCAGYWQRCLDEIVNATSNFEDIPLEIEKTSESETGWSFESVHSNMLTNQFSLNKEDVKTPETTPLIPYRIPCICRCNYR